MANSLIVGQSSSSSGSPLRVEDIINEVRNHYDPDDERPEVWEWVKSKALKDRVTCWCNWFAENNALGVQPDYLVNLEKWDVDFRIFFLAFPGPGGCLLRFVVACYEADKVVCGLSTDGPRELEEWKEMDIFKYILSEDLMARWKKDLCQLLDDIDHDSGNRLANTFRCEEIVNAFYHVADSLPEDFTESTFTWLEEEGHLPETSVLPRMIDRRKEVLRTSVNALGLSVKRAEERWKTNAANPQNFSTSTSYQGPRNFNEGARRRVPTTLTRNSATPTAEAEESRVSANAQVPALHPSNALSNIGNRSQITTKLSRLRFLSISTNALWRILAQLFKSNNDGHRNRNELLDFLIHKSTVLCLTLCIIGTSGALLAVSIIYSQTEPKAVLENPKTPALDSNFYATFAQAMLSLLTIYLTILPPLRSKELNLRYRPWFWLCLLFSAAASIISLAVYVAQPSVSLVFGYGAGFVQVISTLFLVECVEKAVNDGVIGGVEMNA